MNDAFVWVVPRDAAGGLGAHGISGQYFLPVGECGGALVLPGSRLYLVTREVAGDSLFARLTVESLDVEVDEKGSVIGFVLNVDSLRSLQLQRNESREDAHAFLISEMDDFPDGLTALSRDEASCLERFIRRHVRFSFASITPNFLSRLRMPVVRCGAKLAGEILASEITATYALTEMWTNRKDSHPIVDIAEAYLERHPNFVVEGRKNEVMNRLRRLYCSIPGKEAEEAERSDDIACADRVDLRLTPILPEEIETRCFAKLASGMLSIAQMMRKTEGAEARHQNMLRDVASYLIRNGRAPYQSRSIDLAVTNDEATVVFELKSANPENVLDQAAKGLFQLLHHARRMCEAAIPVGAKYLVLERVLPDGESVRLIQILRDAGVGLMVYDESKPWPARIQPDLLSVV